MQVNKAKETLVKLAGVLGLTLKKQEQIPLDSVPFIELLIETRNNLRHAKQWELADSVRDELLKLGVTLEDKPSGTTWQA